MSRNGQNAGYNQVKVKILGITENNGIKIMGKIKQGILMLEKIKLMEIKLSINMLVDSI